MSSDSQVSDGRRYQTENNAKVANLTLGRGYALDPKAADEAQTPARPRSRRTTPQAVPDSPNARRSIPVTGVYRHLDQRTL